MSIGVIAAVTTFQSCKLAPHSITKCCAVCLRLISLHTTLYFFLLLQSVSFCFPFSLSLKVCHNIPMNNNDAKLDPNDAK